MPGLPSLRGVAGSDEDRKSARTEFDTIDDVMKELSVMGFSLNTTPPSFPMPEVSAQHLTTNMNREYTTMYAHQLAWLNYTSPILAHVKAIVLQIENSLKSIEIRIRKDLREKNKLLPKADRLTEKDIEECIWLDPDHKGLVVEQQKYEQMRMQLDSRVEAMRENMKVISRQVEIRKIELGGEKIENNLPGRRYPAIRTP